MRGMSLVELEGLLNERIHAADEFLRISNSLSLSEKVLQRWYASFIRMNMFMAYNVAFYRVTEGLFEAELNRKKMPSIYGFQVRSSMGSLLGESDAPKRLRAYQTLLEEAGANVVLSETLASIRDVSGITVLRTQHPGFFSELSAYAMSYKVTKRIEVDTSREEVLLGVVKSITNDLKSGRIITIPEIPAEEFYPEDSRFGRTARLALNSGKVRQNSHHQRAYGVWRFREILRPLAAFLKEEGAILKEEDIFDHPFAWMLEQLDRYEKSGKRQKLTNPDMPTSNRVVGERDLAGNDAFSGSSVEIRQNRSEMRIPITEAISNNRTDLMVRNIRKNAQPATVFVNAEDFLALSEAQKQEYLFVALSNKAVRMVVYNARAEVRDKELDALLKLDRVTRTDMDLARAEIRFDRPNAPSIHLSKQILPSSELVQRLRKRVSFFRTQGQNGGTLAAALLWAWSGGEDARMREISQGRDGFWTVAETLVNALQRSYDATLAFAVAA